MIVFLGATVLFPVSPATKGLVARFGKTSPHLPPGYVVETSHLMLNHEVSHPANSTQILVIHYSIIVIIPYTGRKDVPGQ